MHSGNILDLVMPSQPTIEAAGLHQMQLVHPEVNKTMLLFGPFSASYLQNRSWPQISESLRGM